MLVYSIADRSVLLIRKSWLSVSSQLADASTMMTNSTSLTNSHRFCRGSIQNGSLRSHVTISAWISTMLLRLVHSTLHSTLMVLSRSLNYTHVTESLERLVIPQVVIKVLIDCLWIGHLLRLFDARRIVIIAMADSLLASHYDIPCLVCRCKSLSCHANRWFWHLWVLHNGWDVWNTVIVLVSNLWLFSCIFLRLG